MTDVLEGSKNKPLVSVIIPAYNAAKTICETLDSVFAQTYTELQVLVANDASTDSTLEKLREYDDPRLEIINLPQNVHVAAARNAALKYAKGDYVAFLDSDDVWVNTKLEQQLAFLEQNDTYGACFTWGEIIDENSQKWALEDREICTLHSFFHEDNHTHKEWFFRFLEKGNCLLNSSALLRADIVLQVGSQNCSLLQLQDFEYWLRALSCRNIYILTQELTKYRRVKNGDALSSSNPENDRRLENESTIVLSHFFDYISDELFAMLFREEFRNQDSSTKEELACERLFLLERAYCGPGPFIIKAQELLSDAVCAQTLIEKFHYMPKDFYRANASCRYAVDIQHLEKRYQAKEQECEQLRSQLNAVIAQNTEILHSSSWRITAPLRKISEMLRHNSS